MIEIQNPKSKIKNISTKSEYLNSKQILISQFCKSQTYGFGALGFRIWSLFRISNLGFRIFTPLESPAIYGGDEKYKNLIPFRKGGVKAPSFLTGFTLCIVILVGLGISWAFAQGEVANMKKVVMIIAHSAFRDEEFLQPKEILEKGGVSVKVASSGMSEATGMLGAKVKPDMLINDINIKDYDAIVFIGGSGASEYWDSPVAHKLAKEASYSNKVVAAICIAPVTLANAGILEGKKATVWESETMQIKKKGAQYTARKVQKDGNIITANGPIAAEEFGQAILESLK